METRIKNIHKKIFVFNFIFLIVFIFVNFYVHPSFAEDAIPPEEETIPEVEPTPEPEPPATVIEKDLILKNSCEVKDTQDTIHTFPNENSPSEYLAICALIAARDAGYIQNLTFTYFPGFGLFVDSINDITNTSAYWALWYNDAYSEEKGLVDLPLSEGDSIALVFTTFDNEETGDKVILHITSLENTSATDNNDSTGDSGGGTNTPPAFDIQKALTYLKSVQSSDGSFGGSLYTDWTGVAFGSMNVTGSAKSKLLNYLNSNNELSSLLTDNERHAMALLSLKQNPYSFDDVNYIDAIANSFDGTQFGDADEDNDDIFALIVLQNAGYTKDEKMLQDDIAFILSAQGGSGAWDGSVDMTAAAIQALKSFKSISGVSNALSKATSYLTNAQNNDGGWGFGDSSVFSTSWVLQAMNALGDSWTKNNKTGIDYLGEQQADDGAVSPTVETLQNRIWATSYAIAAASGKPWSSIMQSVSKPSDQNDSQNDSNNSSTDLSENTDPETPTNPVVCPAGDLFSATTGEACTEFTPTDLPTLENAMTVEVTSPNSHNVINTSQNKKTVVSPKSTTDTSAPEINSDTLTATAVNALPAKTIPYTIPIILGTLSGILLLYLALKFLIK